MELQQLKKAIEGRKARSAWSKGVTVYALELLEMAEENNGADYDFVGCPADKKALLNGADDWNAYSWGGCSLIYNSDIAERLCSPSELKRTRGGDWRPNCNEEWLDVQSRALSQAARLIIHTAKYKEV